MEYKEIKIVTIDKEGIEKDNTFETAYKYPLILSSKPDDLWVKFFHSVYRLHNFEKKRQYTIIDKKLIVIIAGDDSKQQQLDFFIDVTTNANQKYHELMLSKEEERLKEAARKQREKDKIQEMRDEVERLKFQ